MLSSAALMRVSTTINCTASNELRLVYHALLRSHNASRTSTYTQEYMMKKPRKWLLLHAKEKPAIAWYILRREESSKDSGA